MYDNVLMLSQNHMPTCTISTKKARWYVKKGLVEWATLERSDRGYGKYNVSVKCI